MRNKLFPFFVIIFVLSILACVAPSRLDQPIGGVTATPTVKNTPVFVTESVTEIVNTSTPTLTPTITITPTSSIRLVPCNDDICVVPDDDWDVLGRLCTAEVRGFGTTMRDVACASVISTVYTRMQAMYLSDGTVEGTITWNCHPEDKTCEFPAYVYNGCAGILPESCPWSYPDDIAHFSAMAKSIIDQPGGLAGDRYFPDACMNYMYYGSSPEALAKAECTVEGNGQVEGFYN